MGFYWHITFCAGLCKDGPTTAKCLHQTHQQLPCSVLSYHAATSHVTSAANRCNPSLPSAVPYSVWPVLPGQYHPAEHVGSSQSPELPEALPPAAAAARHLAPHRLTDMRTSARAAACSAAAAAGGHGG